MSWLALLACAVHDPPRPDAAHSPGQPLSLNIHHLAAHFFVKVSTAHFPRNTTVGLSAEKSPVKAGTAPSCSEKLLRFVLLLIYDQFTAESGDLVLRQ